MQQPGNVRRVARKFADVPGPDPVNWSVEATDFEYHRNGEVRMIIQRTWHESSGTVSNDELVSIHEVRGNGRRRHMLRPWSFQSDGQGGWDISPDNAAALWTVYDGDEPTADYRMVYRDFVGLVPDVEKNYTLGLAQRTGEGEVKYFHTDHLGTTQAMTDASQTPEPRIVYTAFGEVINTSSPPDTRYLYIGKEGYESFDAVPIIHLGERWYEPGTGRFLQRDPLGIDGGINVYAYAENKPMVLVDPHGTQSSLQHPEGVIAILEADIAASATGTAKLTVDGVVHTVTAVRHIRHGTDNLVLIYRTCGKPLRYAWKTGQRIKNKVIRTPSGIVIEPRKGICGATGLEAVPFLALCCWAMRRRHARARGLQMKEWG